MIDFVMPAVLRPKILDKTLASWREYFIDDPERFRLIINIDPVGDGTAEEVEAVCLKHFRNVVVNKPKQGSLNAALKWLFSQVESEFFLYGEDDVVLTRQIGGEAMFRALRDNKRLAYLQIPWQSFETPELANGNRYVTQTYDGAKGYYLRGNKYRMSLQPSVLRKEFGHAAGALIRLDGIDPEIQFHEGNPELKAVVDKWEFGTFAKPGDKRALADIGEQGKPQGNYLKCVTPDRGTTWLPTRKLNVPLSPSGHEYHVIRHPLSDDHWDQIEAGGWRKHIFQIFDRFLGPETIYLDLGAYVGSTVLYAAPRVKKVFCFECDPALKFVIEHNIMLYNRIVPKPKRNILFSNKAIAPVSGPMPFGPWGHAYGTSRSGFFHGNAAEAIQLNALSLADAIALYHIERIDFLKITLQGIEPMVLFSALDILKQFKPTLAIKTRVADYPDRKAGVDMLKTVLGIYKYLYLENGMLIRIADLDGDGWQDKPEFELVATDRMW